MPSKKRKFLWEKIKKFKRTIDGYTIRVSANPYMMAGLWINLHWKCTDIPFPIEICQKTLHNNDPQNLDDQDIPVQIS